MKTTSNLFRKIMNLPAVILAAGILSSTAIDAQSWGRLGMDIDGEAANDWSGRSVSMPNANTVAIGAYRNDGNGTDAGHVRIYTWNGTAWTQKGADIDGEATNDWSGHSVSMPDANTVAIGAPFNDGNGGDAGHVRIYTWNGTAWTQKGGDIDGEAANDQSGFSVSMPDANTVAIGAPFNDGNGANAGHVRIYTWNGTTWIQKGTDIDGEAANDRSGFSISMPDANTVAIGARLNNGNGTDAGHVRVYTWSGTAWVQKGADIDGEAVNDYSGYSVSMPEANTVAIGARYNDGNGSNAGHVRIYTWNGTAWVQKGADIDGEAVNDNSGYSVSMPDANTVAIGAINNDGNGTDAGHARIYTWNGTAWTQKGPDIDGETAFDYSGASVSMPDANTVAIGAHWNDGNGTKAGHVSIYDCNTRSSFSITACDSFTVPSGNKTYTTSGIYMDTIPNTGGCDSIMTITLTINYSSKSSFSITVCDSYTVPSGDETYTVSGTYMDTIPNTAGCDSVMTISVTINNSNASSFSVTACDSYTVPSGDETYTVSGTYMDTIPNTAGCDSVMTITVTINNSKTSFSVTACDSYTVPSGDETYTVSGTYMDTIPNTAGCDSVMTISVTIHNSSKSSFSDTACDSYTVPSGDETYTVSGTYMDTIPNTAGCDSVMTITVTINTVDTMVTDSSPTLVAHAIDATYQWLNCDSGYAVIPGETGQSFTATANGSYAVEITQNGCTDTSACVSVVNVGIVENDIGNKFLVYPNPTNGNFSIDMGEVYPTLIVSLSDLSGKVIYSRKHSQSRFLNLDINAAAGIYLLTINSGRDKTVVRMIKN